MSDSNKETYYVVNRSKVLSEELDGETIIINLETGNYYSMNKAGSALWSRLQSERPFSSIADELTVHAGADRGVFKQSVDDAIALLVSDGLIVEAPAPQAGGLDHVVPAMSETYEPVTIVRYDDMQEMLLADPIHDVDKTGWPGVKPNKK